METGDACSHNVEMSDMRDCVLMTRIFREIQQLQIMPLQLPKK